MIQHPRFSIPIYNYKMQICQVEGDYSFQVSNHWYDWYEYPVMRRDPFTLSQLTRATIKDQIKCDPDVIKNLEIPHVEKSAIQDLKPFIGINRPEAHVHYVFALDEKPADTITVKNGGDIEVEMEENLIFNLCPHDPVIFCE